MIRSMTGYGEGTGQAQGWTVTVRLKSLNHKYLDLRIRGVEDHPALEFKARELLQTAFARGRIEAVCELFRDLDPSQPPLAFDRELARRYARSLKEIAQTAALEETSPPLGLLLSLEGVARPQLKPEESLWPALEVALRQAIAQVQTMRAREGAHLAGELTAFLESLQGLTDQVAEVAPQLKALFKERLSERVAAVTAGLELELDEARLEEEAVLYAERSDITEELARLRGHLHAARRALETETEEAEAGTGTERKEPLGRVLDFLAQEMAREVNTLGAKARDARISRCVVEMKSQLERFREQVRNVE